MTHDLTKDFDDASKYIGSWSNDVTREVLSTISAGIPGGTVDWDENAGESWGCVLTDVESVALVNAQIPLAFIKARYANLGAEISAQFRLVLVLAEDFDAESFVLRKGKISETLGVSDIELDATETAFSVNDLWFHTV